MKMIEVLNMMAKGEIKEGTKLIASTVLDDYEYRYSTGYRRFFNKYFNEIEDDFSLDEDFLNIDVEMIPPKEKKYLVKFNMRGLRSDIDEFCYLNYVKTYEYVDVDDKKQTVSHKTHFTKKELQSIKPVRKFLEDMQGKYEFIEVKE